MDQEQLEYGLYKEISNKSPEEQQKVVESTQPADNGTKVNSFNSFLSYPKPELDKEALHGIAGEIVRTVDPYTEADQVAILVNILVGSGNLIGRTPYFKVEYSHHYLNLFVSLVGQSSKGRKGQSASTVMHILKQIDPYFVSERVTGGLSSGEGLIYGVRDPLIVEREGEQVVLDDGVDDKRLLLLEGELSQALKVMSREGNILSAIIRQAWDSGDLHPLTKTKPIRATGAQGVVQKRSIS